MHLSPQQLNHWEEKQETAGQNQRVMRNLSKTRKNDSKVIIIYKGWICSFYKPIAKNHCAS